MEGRLSIFEKNILILQKALDSSMMRWNVLSHNLANVNTPGFKRSDIVFAAELKRALDSEEIHKNSIPNKRTHAQHFAFDPTLDYRSVTPKIRTEFDTTLNNNENNVDMAFESGESLKTSLMYNSITSLLQRNFRLLKEMSK